MEKLIKLLNEYERKVRKKSVFYPVWFYDENIGFHHGNTEYNLNDEYVALITGKQYGFIKWLVENDKIDLWSNTFTEKEEHYFGEQSDFTFQSVKYTHLLMLLSISDTPIEDLISYLK